MSFHLLFHRIHPLPAAGKKMRSSLVSVSLLFVILVIVDARSDDPSPNLYSSYVGEWTGRFYVYTPQGEFVKSMEAHHVYKEVDKFTLEGKQTVIRPPPPFLWSAEDFSSQS
jgi:hypothetical protein